MKVTVKPITKEGYKNSSVFHEELALLKAQELICELMEKKNVTKAALAKLLGQSKSHVTELLSGSRNLTLKSFGRICFHLGEQVDFICTERVEHRYKDVRVHNPARIIKDNAGFINTKNVPVRKVQPKYFFGQNSSGVSKVIARTKYGL